MQHALADIRFQTLSDIPKFIDDIIASKPASFFRDDIRMFSDRWREQYSQD